MAVRSLAQSTLRQNPQINSMLAGYQPNAFHHLETVRLGGNSSSVQFTNLARYTDYQHFQIRSAARTNQTGSGGIGTLFLRFNGDTATNYSRHFLFGDSAASFPQTFGEGNTNHMPGHLYANADFSANTFGIGIIDILDPFDTTKNTTIRSVGGVAPKQVSMTSGAWRNTNAIMTIEILTEGFTGNFVAGSRFSLYGIKARA